MNENSQRLLYAAKAVLRGDVGRAYKSLTVPGYDFGDMLQPGLYYGNVFDSFQYRGPGSAGIGMDSGGSWVASIDGNGYNYFRYTGLADATKAYMKCPPLASIINRKAASYINGVTTVLNKEGKEATGSDADKLRTLLAQPNPLQSWEEFEAQNYIYQQIYGYALVLAIKPFGFTANIDANSIWNIPPGMVTIEETNKLFYQTDQMGIIKSMTLDYKGTRTPLNVADVFIIKDFSPSFTTMILPESRLGSLEMPINNIIGAYESRNVLINYRGALGIISQDPGGGGAMGGPLPMTPEQKLELQRDFKRYGTRNKQIQFIITKATLKWQQMGYPTKELMLFEEVEADTQAICDAYNYPFRLLSSNSSNSLGGTDAAIFGRNLYQDAIMPEAQRIYAQWGRFFGLDKLKLKLNKDYSEVAILQDDQVAAGMSRFRLNQALLIEWQNNLLTWNEWRIAIGDEPKGPEMDIYYTDMVQQGKIFGAQPIAPVGTPINETTTTAAPAAA